MDKRTIKVLILTGDGQAAKKIKLNNNKSEYTGLTYDIWNKIRERLKDNYTFKEIYKDRSEISNAINDVNIGKYDIAIGFYQKTEERMKKINFTLPIYTSKDSILFSSKMTLFTKLKILFNEIILQSMIFLFIMSIILGIIFVIFSNNNFRKHLSNEIYSVLAALVGGKIGLLFNKKNKDFKTMLLILFISVFSLMFIIFLRADTTVNLDGIEKNKEFTIYNMKNKHFLARENYGVAKNIERYGSKITYVKNVTMKQLIDKYKKNLNKYDGITLDIYDARILGEQYNLTVTESSLGYSDLGYIINKKYPNLLIDINSEIDTLRQSFFIKKMCAAYFISNKDVHLCIL